MPFSRRVPIALLSVLPALMACSSGADSDDEEPRPTVIAVGPEDFLGTLTCRNSGLESYVVTLEDVDPKEDDAGAPFELPMNPTSPRTPCDRTVAFGCPGNRDCLVLGADVGIVAGRNYEAVVEGYDGTSDAPAWTVRCEKVRAELRQTRRPRCATPLIPAGTPPGAAAVEIDLEAAFGTELCGDPAQPIESFVVYRDDVEVGRAACGGVVLLTEDIQDGDVLDLQVLAFEVGLAEPSLGAACTARAIGNATVVAACDPLSANGAIVIELSDVVAATGAACDANLTELRLDSVLPDEAFPTLTFPGSACGESSRIRDRAPGAYTFVATAQQATGETPTATCTALVEPGLVATLACEAP